MKKKKEKLIEEKRIFKKACLTNFSYPIIIYKKEFLSQIQKIIIFLLVLCINIYNKNIELLYKRGKNKFSHLTLNGNKNNIYKDNLFTKLNFSDFNNNKFAIIKRTNCPSCGLFSFYIVYLGCINKYLSKGYIPIIDMKSFKNVYNNYNTLNNNSWEFFFEQPFGYTLEEVEKKAKIKQYKECTSGETRPSEINIYYNQVSMNYWHDFANKFMPIKKEIINEANNIMKELFHNSNNILGVKIRGTDYIAMRPRGHPIPPDLNTSINEVKNIDNKNDYDWIFISTEDEIVKERYIKEFSKKIKYLNPKEKVNYDYKQRSSITKNEVIKGNLDYAKNYLLNVIILSKCTDLVTARCSGAAGVFVITEGFRNTFIFNLGEY